MNTYSKGARIINALQIALLIACAIACFALGFVMTIGLYPMPGQWTDAIFYCVSIALALSAGIRHYAYRD